MVFVGFCVGLGYGLFMGFFVWIGICDNEIG